MTFKGKVHSEETKRKISIAQKGKSNSMYGVHRFGRNAPNYGKPHSTEVRRKMSEVQKGRATSEETKQKMRVAAIARMERNMGQVKPNYSPEACGLIEEYGKRHGYNFRHAENGGEFHVKELGYFVDGYDTEKNVVIEVDESYHYQGGKLRKKDMRRQQKIERHLNCKFIRIRIGV